MTLKNTKTLLIAVLVAVLIPTTVFASDSLYSELFPNDRNTSDDVKAKVIANLQSDETIDLPLPENQLEVGQRAYDLMMQIDKAAGQSIADDLQKELDSMTVEMLKAGIVIREKYESDPKIWDELLREFEGSESESSNIIKTSHNSYNWKAGVQYKYWCYGNG